MKRQQCEPQTEEPILAFTEPEQYYRAMQVFILPSDSRTLLACGVELARFIDCLSVSSSSNRDERINKLPAKLLDWYLDVRSRRDNPLYRMNRLCYWVGYVRAFWLAITRGHPDLYRLYRQGTTASFDYCALVSGRYNIVVSDEPLGAYSINDMRHSIKMLINSLHTFRFGEAMKRYVHALFFRYASLVMCGSDDETVFDNPAFFSPIGGQQHEEENRDNEKIDDLLESFAHMAIQQQGGLYAINTSFIFDGEKLFQPHLHRLFLSGRLSRARLSLNLRATPRFVQRCLTVWRDFTLQVAEDRRLTGEVIAQFRQKHVDMYMHHGERERYCEQFPYASNDNREVLMETRPRVLSEIAAAQEVALRALIKSYAEQLASGEVDPPQYELECVLLTRVTHDVWFRAEDLDRHVEMRDAFLCEELVPSLRELDERIYSAMNPPPPRKNQVKGTNRGKRAQRLQARVPFPLLVRLMRRYYVVERTEGRVYQSDQLVEAVFVWLWLCHRERLIPQQMFHPKTLTLLREIDGLVV